MRTPAGSIPAAGLAAAPRTTKTVQRRERPQRGLHIMLAGLIGALVLLISGCGRDAQTLQPYTQAMGVNADVGRDPTVKVRNLLIVSRQDGQGFLSASLISTGPDALVGVAGVAIERDATAGAPLEANLTAPIPLEPGDLVVLTERPVIRVSSPDLRAGAMARVVLQFDKAGELEILVPIYRSQDELETISPIPESLPTCTTPKRRS
jgi:hypothetical protein